MQKSANVFGECLGLIEIILEINNHSEKARFFVMALGNLHEEVVLSQTWMTKRNCSIGWTHRSMSFLNANQEVTIVILVQDVKRTSPKALECNKSLPKKLTTTVSTYKDKGKAKMESDTPTSSHGLIT